MLEKELQAKCLRYLKTIKAWSVKTIASNRAGVPDILACINGKFIAFEIKRKGESVTPLQAYNGREIRTAGGEWFMIDDYEKFKQIINSIKGVSNVN
jgi:hypothetical protein